MEQFQYFIQLSTEDLCAAALAVYLSRQDSLPPPREAACTTCSTAQLSPLAANCHVAARVPFVPPFSKLDALATEYNHLLVTQLESQRQFFEGQLVKQRQELDAEVTHAGSSVCYIICGFKRRAAALR